MQEHSAVVTQVTAAIRKPKDADAETVFVWLTTNRYLWMLNDEHLANQVETVVGTKMVLDLIIKLRPWKKKHTDHPALQQPVAADQRERAFQRLEKFFILNIQLDDLAT